VGRFRDELVCNLNFRQPDQDDTTTADFAFAFPDYCVQSVASTSFTGDTCVSPSLSLSLSLRCQRVHWLCDG
jgi:hypothetical protein